MLSKKVILSEQGGGKKGGNDGGVKRDFKIPNWNKGVIAEKDSEDLYSNKKEG